ncbi:MAG: hypothetical protein AVDCRST_MAG78-2905 [uncultured Rubrobacteraceae bacterium]|uniref:Uncharacterized protein n=1 Tax=uncultured Rubrobacteraceae bacterium TaxID=349277 RepID=A0A6J4QKL7_9ACTN|nr:MAG: hypothetical protein AVDCRST_MAG78-2905 [uncultured Rubrobacteraceae bacterium]
MDQNVQASRVPERDRVAGASGARVAAKRSGAKLGLF